jgi:hypothetical protein
MPLVRRGGAVGVVRTRPIRKTLGSRCISGVALHDFGSMRCSHGCFSGSRTSASVRGGSGLAGELIGVLESDLRTCRPMPSARGEGAFAELFARDGERSRLKLPPLSSCGSRRFAWKCAQRQLPSGRTAPFARALDNAAARRRRAL